jgi:hypothetical protein
MPVQEEAKVLGGAIKGTTLRRGKLVPFKEAVFILG